MSTDFFGIEIPGFEDNQEDNQAGCYRHKFSGIYKTKRPPNDVVFKPDWIFIHNGPCQCDGEDITTCIEPGDGNLADTAVENAAQAADDLLGGLF